MLCVYEFVFKIGQYLPLFSGYHYINKVFRTMYLKPDTVSIIPRAGYRMEYRQTVEALKWLA